MLINVSMIGTLLVPFGCFNLFSYIFILGLNNYAEGALAICSRFKNGKMIIYTNIFLTAEKI